jgi:hypothetical protein
VSLLQTLPYFRSEFPDMQMSIISETFRQSWSWWSDAINTINWVHGTNLSQNAAIGDNHIHVASTTGFSNGQTVKIHDSTVGNFETMVISTVGTLVLNFTSTLTKAYTTAHTANVFDPAISMGWDGELDEGYLGLDGMLGRANRYLYAQKMALGGTVDFVVLSNQSQGFITSVPEQIALIESINALEPVPNKTVTTVLS